MRRYFRGVIRISVIFLSSFLVGGVSADSDANRFIELAKKAVPFVVNISTLSTIKSPFVQGNPDDLFRRFFEEFFGHQGIPFDENGMGGEGESEAPSPSPPKRRRNLPKAVSLGSGFIIDPSGIILTNNHVVAEADEIKILFTEAIEERPTDAEVIGRDPDLDVALIRVKGKLARKLVAADLGDSDQVQIGEYVMAIGNPFGQGHSVTHGIISQKGRIAPEFPLATYIQTDAPINPGNSGGPLVNLKGEVIAINNAIEARAQGIGFAIPINVVKEVLPQLKTKGVVTRGYLGVLVGDLTPEIAEKLGVPKKVQGPFVTQVFEDGPAAEAGLKPYDVVVEFNGKPVHSGSELIAAVTSVPVGQVVPIKIYRGSKQETLKVKIAQRPGPSEIGKGKGEKRKKEKEPTHMQTGMSLKTVDPEIASELGVPKTTHGVLVLGVEFGSAAERAGLMRGDIILDVDQKPIKTVNDFYSRVKEKKQYLLRVRRGNPQFGETFFVAILDLLDSSDLKEK